MKIGRNDTCWCGSGKKYKKCHLGKEREVPLMPWESQRDLMDAFGAKYCLAPKNMQHDCSGSIVKAHTIPKSVSLRSIARNGHVYAIRPSINTLIKTNGLFEPELIGINKASTFTGFCSMHDNNLFRELENKDFLGTEEQCFLLAYRTVSRELFMKTSACNLFKNKSVNLARGKNIEQQREIHLLTSGVRLGMEAGLRDMKHYKHIYDDILTNRRFGDIRSYQIYLENPPSVMASGSIFPEYDFGGNALQDLSLLDKTPQLLNFTSFYSGRNGVVVFCWLPQSDVICNKFITSLDRIHNSDMANSIIRFLFEFCENICIFPDWWERQDNTIKIALQKRMVASCTPTIGRKRNCLVDDGMTYDLWNVINRKIVNV